MNRVTNADERPPVSLIIPIRNEEARIQACIESVLTQDYPLDKMEILVLDGMSTDRTREIIQGFMREHPQVRLVDNPDKTQVVAVNKGIRLARGRYILRMDGHSEYAPDYVSKCVHYLEKTGADNVGGPCRTYPASNTRTARTIAAITQNKYVVGGSAFRVSLKPQYCDTCVFGAWRRELFDQIGLFNKTLVRGEDNEFNSRIMKYGGKIFMTPDIRVRYYNQATLRGLLRQAYGNGVWHILTMAAFPKAFKFRYFAPFAFVMWFIVFGLLTMHHPLFVIPLAAGAVPYGLLLALVTVQVGKGHGWDLAPFAPLCVLPYHVAYGLGTLAGLFKFGLFGSEYRRRAREGSRIPDPANPPRLGQNALSEEEIAALGPRA
ncbi:MAG TPA: glycosyltransferase family 2 protein [Phycisphaerae bacterium]|nr:glycosyltransferase family 2 protein [Phycisphaerae bacterium]